MIPMSTIIVHTADMSRSWTADQIRQYIFAGHAVFAVNGIIYTIRDNHNKHGWWRVLTLDDETYTWIPIGWVVPDILATTREISEAKPYKYFTFKNFVWWLKNHGLLPDRYNFQISRFCARCGTPLKSAKSQALGYGRECLKEMKEP